MDSYVQTGIKYFESNNYIILTSFFALFCQKNLPQTIKKGNPKSTEKLSTKIKVTKKFNYLKI